mgnify:FL=1
MVKQINVKSLSQVKEIVKVASRCSDDIGVHDEAGAIADAKSILGLMRLDYTKPVRLVSENEAELEYVARAIRC